MSKLKPCPFCGEELIVLPNGKYYSHPRERKCFGSVWVFEVDDEEFIKLWNTRKPMDKVVEQLEEKSFYVELTDGGWDGYCVELEDAIDIVKEGGIE